MKLEEIHGEILNEAISGPLAAFEYALRAAGKGISEANGALLRAVQKINPSVRQLYRATDEEISKALLRVEFKEYRQIIAKSIIANKEREIYLILKASDLTTTQGIKQAKADIANRLGVKNAFANEIVNLKIPKISRAPRVTPLVQNTDELWSYFNQEMKSFGVLRRLKPEDQRLFILELRSAIQKEITKISPRFEIQLNNLKKAYEKLSPTEQKEMLVKVRDNIKKLGEEKNLSQKITNSLYTGLVDFLKNAKDSKFTSNILIGSTIASGILDLIRLSAEDGTFKGHFGMDIYTTIGIKVISSFVSKLLLALNPYTIFIYVGLTLDSIVRYINFLYNRNHKKDDRTKVQKLVDKVSNKADTLSKKYSPKLDSVRQEYQPKIDSTLQSLKNKLNPQPPVLDKTGKPEIPNIF